MTKEEKRLLGVSVLFGGVIAAAYLIAPDETSIFLNAAQKVLAKKDNRNKVNYSEAEDVDFVMVENPKSSKGATRSV